ncbi:hypothetical protein C9374_007184 [Naegleria lovaniensis]|uniref:Protein phosphatase n=1 Tax=Naegleria lovaniensis TaxID=51637 RepID=A0AA88KPX1_NAELO|nr:uncharacterized protein C9374_007184 [Naegleria lovaniensis]KAG2393653.1 hypothetical protein C9374_007184 [Naegleria lovaniensis]
MRNSSHGGVNFNNLGSNNSNNTTTTRSSSPSFSSSSSRALGTFSATLPASGSNRGKSATGSSSLSKSSQFGTGTKHKSSSLSSSVGGVGSTAGLSSASTSSTNSVNISSSSPTTTIDSKVTSPKPNTSPLIHFFSSSTSTGSKRGIGSAGGDFHQPVRNSFSVNASNSNPNSLNGSKSQPTSPLGRKKNEEKNFQSLTPTTKTIAPISPTSSNKQALSPFTVSTFEEEEDVDTIEASYINHPITPIVKSNNPFDLHSTYNINKQLFSEVISPSKIPLLTPPPIPKSKLNLQYRIKKASGSGADANANISEKALKVSVYSKQKPMCDENTHPTGEDAYYCCYSAKHEVYSFGIADGVGGWMAFDIDPSLVSRQLMWNCKLLLCSDQLNQIVAENNYHIPKEYEPMVARGLELPQVVHPKILLERAFRLMTEFNQVKAGGTTACIIFLKPLPQNLYQLSYANLGDSGFAVVNKQKSKVIYRSKEQQHYFNAPYQLSVIPPELDSDELIKDDPSCADLHINCCTLREGDYIVLATDGLFDNLFDSDILKIMRTATSCHSISKKLVQEAVKRYNSPTLPNHTPFSMGLSKVTGEFKRHGKSDDVTVCCVSVCCN